MMYNVHSCLQDFLRSFPAFILALLQTSQLQNELSEIKEDLEEQKKRCADLEDLNTTWSNQNIQLTEQLQFTKVCLK